MIGGEMNNQLDQRVNRTDANTRSELTVAEEKALRSRIEALEAQLSKPQDEPEVTSWAFDMSPAQGFIDYVAKNYSGEVVFHDPEWHALRLWNAALKHAKPEMVRTAPPRLTDAQPAPALTDERINDIILSHIGHDYKRTYLNGDEVPMSAGMLRYVGRAILQAAQPVQPCRTCKGTGIDGDCGPDGAPVSFKCAGCDGTGAQPQGEPK